MCGRFALIATGDTVAETFELEQTPVMAPRYNIAPTQPVAAVRENRHTRQRELTYFRWGLIPFWSKDVKIGNRLINARSETAAEKPAFRAAYRYRRCLVPASGFYEWQKTPEGKQPYYIHRRGGGILAIAGLWEQWSDAEGNEIETCTLLTTSPNELMEPLHNRMPVIVDPADFATWLDVQPERLDQHQHLLRPYPAGEMDAYPVSTLVNNPRNDVPDILARA